MGLAQAPRGTAIIVNPGSGPGERPDFFYEGAIAAINDRAQIPVGYIDSNYGKRTAADVAADAECFSDWYGIDRFFLDQVDGAADRLDHYRSVAGAISGIGRFTAMNFGQPVIDPGYAELCELTANFEGDLVEYAAAKFPAPEDNVVSRSWHFVYGVRTTSELERVLGLARSRGVARIFVTDAGMPNPWSTCPPYWNLEIAAVADQR